MPKYLAVAAGVAFILLLAQKTVAEGRDRIVVVGSSPTFPVANIVAQEFAMRRGGPVPYIEVTGTTIGLLAFCQGAGPTYPDLVGAARRMKKEELETCDRRQVGKILEIPIAYNALVLVQSKGAARLDVSSAQLWQALAKQVMIDGTPKANPHRRWSDIDPSLPETKIEVMIPPEDSGSRDFFVRSAMVPGCHSVPGVLALDPAVRDRLCRTFRGADEVVAAEGDAQALVEWLQAKPGRLVPVGFAFTLRRSDLFQTVKVDGAAPTIDAINSGAYPVSLRLYFYAKSSHFDAIPGLKEFVKMLVSEAAIGPSGVFRRSYPGYIPLNGDDRRKARRIVEEAIPVKLRDLD